MPQRYIKKLIPTKTCDQHCYFLFSLPESLSISPVKGSLFQILQLLPVLGKFLQALGTKTIVPGLSDIKKIFWQYLVLLTPAVFPHT
jgi:hypothetical protein